MFISAFSTILTGDEKEWSALADDFRTLLPRLEGVESVFQQVAARILAR